MRQGSIRLWSWGAVFLAVLAATAWSSSAAALSGDLRGKIVNAEQKPVAGATVTLLRAGKADSSEQASDAGGSFAFKGLASGVYIATVSLEGYSPVTCPGVRVVSGARQLQVVLAAAASEAPEAPQGSEAPTAPETDAPASSCQPVDN